MARGNYYWTTFSKQLELSDNLIDHFNGMSYSRGRRGVNYAGVLLLTQLS